MLSKQLRGQRQSKDTNMGGCWAMETDGKLGSVFQGVSDGSKQTVGLR